MENISSTVAKQVRTELTLHACA